MEALGIMANYPEEVIYVKVASADIDLFNKIMEAYDNQALVTTVDPKLGKIALWVTPDTKLAVLKIITKIPCRVELWQD